VSDGGWLIVEVRDTGIGMTREEMGKLFQPFQQANAQTSRQYGGTGLGLALSRRLCDLMGGTIGVSSEPGAGSTFTVKLPLRTESSAAAAVHTAAAAIDAPAPSG
jgi:signal transduction histidine kinase